MRFYGDGYTSEAGQKAGGKLVTENIKIFSELDRTINDIRSFAASQEIFDPDALESHQKITALLLLARILEISEASCLLMKNGMNNESTSLFRVFLDAYFLFGCVCSDATFVAEYFQTDSVARLKLMNVAQQQRTDIFDRIKIFATENIKNELKKQIDAQKTQEFNSFNYARKIDCSHIYDSVYRIASASLHSTPHALLLYAETNHLGTILAINCCPPAKDIPQRIYDLTYFLIKVYSGINDVFGCLNQKEIDARINILESIKTQI